MNNQQPHTPRNLCRANTRPATPFATRFATTATLALALLAGSAAQASDSRDKAPDYSVPGVGTLIGWLFGR